MTIKMRLDTAGLRALIADNPELEVQIGAEVLRNIADYLKAERVEKAVERKLNTVLGDMVSRSWSGGGYRTTITNTDFKQAANAIVKEFVEHHAQHVLQTMATDIVRAVVKDIKAGLVKELHEKIAELITPETARAILLEALK